MKVGDLVRLTRGGSWDNIIGIVVGRGIVNLGRLSKVRVLWGTTGKTEIHFVERLEVI